jgi:hypothetical protein
MQDPRASKPIIWGVTLILLALVAACDQRANETAKMAQSDQRTPLATGVAEDIPDAQLDRAQGDQPIPIAQATDEEPGGRLTESAENVQPTSTVTIGLEEDRADEKVDQTDGEQPACRVTVKAGDSIQQAIEQAQPGAVICLSTGRWDENLVISDSITLRGEGGGPEEVKKRSR